MDAFFTELCAEELKKVRSRAVERAWILALKPVNEYILGRVPYRYIHGFYRHHHPS